MFDSLNDGKLRAAYDAARLLYDHRRALGLDPTAIKLDTLRADIAAELEHRSKSAAPGGGTTASAGTEHELLALVRAAMGDCGGEGHLWVTEDISRDPAASDNVLISQRLECTECPAQKRVTTLHHPQPTPAEARE
jgi:hypothetical protein